MKRIASIILILALAVSAACAESGIVYTDRYLAVNAAQHALAEKYGIAEGQNEYFIRTATEEADGSYTVLWQPAITEGAYPWLLGTYRASVRGDEVTIEWSHDGEDTSGGYEAAAWGAEQLERMADEVRTGWEMAESWAAAQRTVYAGRVYPDDTAENPVDLSEEARKQAEEAASLTPKEAEEIARAALAEIYGALEWERLTIMDGTEYEWDMGLLYGRPVIVIVCSLWGQGAEDWEWQPGDGRYEVTVNLENGAVEEILYTNCLSGNG